MPTYTPVSAKPSIISSLQDIFNDPEVSKDAKFMDNLLKVFEDNETSLIFTPHLNKLKLAFYEGGHSMKKRILTETNVNKQRNSEANANENKNKSALSNIAQENGSKTFDMLKNL